MSEGFRFGDARARDDRGGCCGKPVGCWLESQGCTHKVEKARWQAEVAGDPEIPGGIDPSEPGSWA